MDPLTITASVAKITAVGLTSATTLRDLCTKFKDAGITIASICNETTIISASLVQIQSLLIQDPQASSNQFRSRPELLATFDTALTGCMVVFSCLDDEVRKLTARPTDPRNLRWKTRLRAVWNGERMNDLLVQLRGQQSAISVLIQVMQMESLSEMKQIIQENSAVLEKVAHRTQSLRQSNRHVPIPESILGTDTTRESMTGEAASRSSMAEFDFDELIVTSGAYRRALAAARRQVSKGKRKVNTPEGDLIDLSEPGASIPTVQVPREIFDDLRSLRLSMVDEQFDIATLPNAVDQMVEDDDDASSDRGSFYRSFQSMGLVLEESEENDAGQEDRRSHESAARTMRISHENISRLSATLIPMSVSSNTLSSSDAPASTSKNRISSSNNSVASYTSLLASPITLAQISPVSTSASDTLISPSSALALPFSATTLPSSPRRTPHTSISTFATSISSHSTLALSPEKVNVDKEPPSDMGVQFLAASLFEFNASSTQEVGQGVGKGGIPFLSYSPGEIFDIVSVHGETWLAISQDDDRKQGWVWEKHFARISPESSSPFQTPDLKVFTQQQRPERLSDIDEPTLVTESPRLGWGRSFWSGFVRVVDEISS